ncbi:uncharacterized protein GIQ15_04162 [Arthroderma uncinatum]|uniref:uncharacterized protein n=1 Tax=Arthroderma uncinatum TaxID=74035 RepID=UPI00144A6C8F|nr:uncharacterized protein GIQ15_04162 [Arthroderma uncinatum]KAF3481403.1 hypothetical protein GIQ15_04162 [Arthroderma uncinatum]
MESGTQIDVLKLFKAPNKWRPSYTTGLHIETQEHTSAAAIFGSTLLPKDDDPLFETVATAFAEPSREELSLLRTPFNNPFWDTFNDIWQAMRCLKNGWPVEGKSDAIALGFIRATGDKYLGTNYSYKSISFKCGLKSVAVRGKLTGVGTYHRTADKGLPFTVFVGTKGAYPLCTTEEVVPYLLLQAILKYNRNPTLETYHGFVVGVKGSTLQFNKGAVSREYLEGLIRTTSPSRTVVENVQEVGSGSCGIYMLN